MNTLDSTDDVPDVTFYSVGTALNLFTNSDINPYIILGAGGANFNIDKFTTRNRFIMHAGAGVKYFFNNTFALRLDARDYISINDTSHNYSASIGITVAFDIYRPEKISLPTVIDKKEVEEDLIIQKAKVTQAVDTEKTAQSDVQVEMKPEAQDSIEIGERGVKVFKMEAVKRRVPLKGGLESNMKEIEYMVIREREEHPEEKIIILYKGAQIFLQFPYRSNELKSESYDLLMELVSYEKEKDIKRVKIVCYSYDYGSMRESSKLNKKRKVKLKEFISEHSNIPENKIILLQQDEEAFIRFRELSKEKGGYMNRAYVVISFH